MPAFFVVAYSRAVARMSSAGMPVTISACSGVKSLTAATTASKFSVLSAMNASSHSSSVTMTLAIAFSSQTSVPGRSFRCRSAMDAIQIERGSATTSLAPRRTARFISIAMIGCASEVLLPMTNRKSASRISPMEFVIAPAPNVVTRPATVGACQVAAHWWMLFVWNTARESFWTR
ncbi:MAG: hypothetical protein IPG72_04385 [Ardenticatenales bacterium]|nr:hypothetical protein [Ardenticatenales bacterium]